MKAMILAAGKGTRVQPLTYDMPKPMIPVLGKPVMETIVEQLARHGIRDIMVNVSHLGYRIEQYFGDGRRLGVNIGYSFEGYLDEDEIVPQPVGSAGALRRIQDFGGFFDTTTVVLCGDAIVDLDFGAALAEHRRRRARASVITLRVPMESVSSYGVVGTDFDGRVVSFQEKPSRAAARSDCVSTGIYILEPDVIDMIPRGRPFDIGSELFPLLVERGVDFYAQLHSFNWIDIGKVSDYWRVIMSMMRRPAAGLSMPGHQSIEGIWTGLNTSIDWRGTSIRGPVYIGSGARIEAGCRIEGPVWIGHGCHVGAGARVSQCVLFEYA
ncbi:MAG: NDP-sugar synthase, partial [Betaproteobacteria bacterium]|nr:NDP-sugar synthase [Betaproteobacteria bacterium]